MGRLLPLYGPARTRASEPGATCGQVTTGIPPDASGYPGNGSRALLARRRSGWPSGGRLLPTGFRRRRPTKKYSDGATTIGHAIAAQVRSTPGQRTTAAGWYSRKQHRHMVPAQSNGRRRSVDGLARRGSSTAPAKAGATAGGEIAATTGGMDPWSREPGATCGPPTREWYPKYRAIPVEEARPTVRQGRGGPAKGGSRRPAPATGTTTAREKGDTRPRGERRPRQTRQAEGCLRRLRRCSTLTRLLGRHRRRRSEVLN